jgi:DNA-binding FrmR family transcriptional regulator
MERDKKDLLNRLKTIEGHIRGDDVYCIDIIQQTQAVQSALEKFNSVVLANHLNHCVTTAIRGDDAAERERVVNELVQVFDPTSRKKKNK